jgi:hypothetical protein
VGPRRSLVLTPAAPRAIGTNSSKSIHL